MGGERMGRALIGKGLRRAGEFQGSYGELWHNSVQRLERKVGTQTGPGSKEDRRR